MFSHQWGDYSFTIAPRWCFIWRTAPKKIDLALQLTEEINQSIVDRPLRLAKLTIAKLRKSRFVLDFDPLFNETELKYYFLKAKKADRHVFAKKETPWFFSRSTLGEH